MQITARTFTQLIFLSITMLQFNACKKEVPETPCSTDEGLYRKSTFPIGAAINIDTLNSGSSYKKIATDQFNSVTAENIFKPAYLHPQEHLYDWVRADQLVGYCEYHQKRIHGHTLIWHEQLPAWMNNYEGNAEEWEAMMKEHIQTIVTHFKGKVAAWDVLNEAFNDDGTLRHTIWLEHLGPGYIEKAYQYAKEADPDALLFYNDYLLEMNPAKRKAVLDYFNAMKNRGMPIDGIGLQMHVSIHYPEMEQFADALAEISAQGYKIHLSELDISLNPFNQTFNLSDDLLRQQAAVLATIVQHYKSVPSAQQYGITFWGISDRDSWIRYYFHREDYPLLFDENYQPKPAYCKLKESL
jgi:endo-1,4-beta-xylanase